MDDLLLGGRPGLSPQQLEPPPREGLIRRRTVNPLHVLHPLPQQINGLSQLPVAESDEQKKLMPGDGGCHV